MLTTQSLTAVSGVARAAAEAPGPEAVSPGLAGFLVMFGLALATVVLIGSMVGHLRKVNYSRDPSDDDAGGAADADDPASTDSPR